VTAAAVFIVTNDQPYPVAHGGLMMALSGSWKVRAGHHYRGVWVQFPVLPVRRRGFPAFGEILCSEWGAR